MDLAFEGMRDTYLSGVPPDAMARIPAESWEMEAHVLDGGHMLLETHATEVAGLMVDFITRTRA